MCAKGLHTPSRSTEPSWHRNARAARKRARATIKKASSGLFVSIERLEEAAALLLQHHGTRGAAAEQLVTMVKDDFTMVGGRRKDPPHPLDWQCPDCHSKENQFYVFKKHSCCPGRPGQVCGRECPKKPVRFGTTKEGKAVAAAKAAKNGQAAGQAPTAKDPKAEAELKKLRAENKKLQDAAKKVAAPTADVDVDEDDDMEEEGDGQSSKESLEAEIIVIKTDVFCSSF